MTTARGTRFLLLCGTSSSSAPASSADASRRPGGIWREDGTGRRDRGDLRAPSEAPSAAATWLRWSKVLPWQGCSAPRRPLLAGLVIGAVCTVANPLPAALIPLLFCYRAEPESGIRRWPQRAAVAAAASAGLLFALVGARYLPEMLARADVAAPSEHDLSLTRILRAFGLHPGAGLLFLVVTALAAFALWRLRPDTRGFNSIAVTASVLALPIVWPHTLAITFPTQFHALERGFRFAHGQVGWRRFAPALVLAAMLSIQGSSGGGAAPIGWPAAAKGLLAAIPVAALCGLCAYAVVGRPPRISAPSITS